jgi:hypothetical protein
MLADIFRPSRRPLLGLQRQARGLARLVRLVRLDELKQERYMGGLPFRMAFFTIAVRRSRLGCASPSCRPNWRPRSCRTPASGFRQSWPGPSARLTGNSLRSSAALRRQLEPALAQRLFQRRARRQRLGRAERNVADDYLKRAGACTAEVRGSNPRASGGGSSSSG